VRSKVTLEPNDSKQQAGLWAWPHTTFITTGLSICPTDIDWFSVKLGSHDTLIANIGFRDAEGDLDMKLYSDARDPIRASESTTDNEHIEYESSSGGFYYIKVYHAESFGENRNYDLALQVVASTPTPTGTPSPTPTATPMVDLVVEGLEVTQGIQGYPLNDVQLVADKTTWARLYFRSDLRDVCCVTAHLRLINAHGVRDLDPVNGPLKARTGGSRRAHKGDTLNFLIPPEYRKEGTLVIQPRLNYDHAVPESDYGNNNPVYSRNFTERNTLNIVFVRVRYHIEQPPTPLPGTPTVVPLTVTPTVLVPPKGTGPRGSRYTRNTYPVARVKSWLPITGDTIDFEGELSTRKGWDELLNEVSWLAAHTQHPPGVFKWYGLVPVLHGALRGGLLGLAKTPGQSGIGYVRDTLAHEVAHNFNRYHAPCGNPDWLDASFPYAQGKIEQFGFDPDTQQVYDPAKTYDFMSYCNPAWVSPYTFEALYHQIGGPTVTTSNGATQEQDYLLISGEVDIGADTGQLHEAYVDTRPVGSADGTGEGPYQLEVCDGTGTPLFTRHFDPGAIPLRSDGSAVDASVAPWLEMLPFPAGAQRIVLLHEGAELDARAVSAHAPAVTVEHPNGGEALNGTVDVHWTGGDPDGDTLIYTLQYSIDAGETWSAAEVNLRDTHYVLDTEVMAGTDQGKIRVLTSDGINTAADESDDVFSVPKKPPEVYVLWPESGRFLAPQEMVLLLGTATDLEDGPLADEALNWTSDRDGELGSGAEVTVLSLSLGWHEITVTATDSDDNTATDSIQVYVGYRTYLPIILRQQQPSRAPEPASQGASNPLRGLAVLLAATLLGSFGVLSYAGGRR
jgi:hypothetical protein